MSYSIVIADDHDIIREGIKSILKRDEKYEVLAEADNGEDALRLVEEHKPDLLLLDITMPRRSGLDLISQIHHTSPETKIVIITMHRAAIYIQKVLKLGVMGYLHKENVSEDLLPALRRIVKGAVYFGPRVAQYFMDEHKEKPREKRGIELTSRETDILRLLVDGKTAKEIAEILFISRRTVENYKNTMLKKLSLHKTADLIKYALMHKIVEPED